MNVKTATTICVTLILVLFVLLGASLIKITGLLDREVRDLAMAGESISVVKKLKAYLLIHNRNAFFYSFSRDQNRRVTSKNLKNQISSTLESAKLLIQSEEAESAFAKLDGEITSYLEKMERLENLELSAIEEYNELSKDVDRILPVIDKLIDVKQSRMDALVKRAHDQNKMANRIGLLLLAIGSAMLLSLMGMMFFYIARPLRIICEDISKYGSGKTSVRIEPRGLMEIRQIGSSFNSMAERLEEKQREQLRFISAIAHDLRNPLNSMSMAAGLLHRKVDQGCGDLIAVISRQVKNLDRMVGDLIDTTRIEAGHLDLQFSSLDINSLIKDSIQLHQAGSEIHHFNVDLPNEPLLCQCDGARISQVLNNLLSNAIKYSPDGGAVTVRARMDGEKIVISITDEGIGIASQDLNDIFKPFNRTKATRGTIPGIGLGLSASRHIVEGHGGKLWVESKPGAGSTFYFLLPLKKITPFLRKTSEADNN